jgi:hypothetical protein
MFKVRHVDPTLEIHIPVSKWKDCSNGMSCGMMEYIHPDDLLKWRLNCWIEKLTGKFGKDFIPK